VAHAVKLLLQPRDPSEEVEKAGDRPATPKEEKELHRA
jgi:hypothetical protein